MKDKPDSPDTDQPDAPGRRALLVKATKAMPVVLTLQSGAALARSSNLISGANPASVDLLDRTLCLDLDSVIPADDLAGVYDAGDPVSMEITAIRDHVFREEPRRRAREISRQELCETGRVAYYHERGWHAAQAQSGRGMIVSATAMTSFTSGMHITEI